MVWQQNVRLTHVFKSGKMITCSVKLEEKMMNSYALSSMPQTLSRNVSCYGRIFVIIVMFQ